MYPGASLWLLLPSVLLVLSSCRAADPGSWGDWVILDEAEPGTSILLRRITPKSVFVAPTFSCSEGYRQDALGRCIKHVKVNQAEQWKFYLDRLNSMYAPASSNKKPQKEAGPFHISLPIGSDHSQEDVVVKKRLPPVIRDQVVKTTSTTTEAPTTTTTTLPPPTTTLPPATTMPTPATTVQESTTPEVTGLDTTEVTSTEREFNSQPEITTESRGKYETTELEESPVMLGDQPSSAENSTGEESPVMLGDQPSSAENSTGEETPKKPSQLTDKPFVIIVTSEPGAATEESVFVPVTAFTAPTTTEREEEEEASSESAATTEGTTSRYTTEGTTSRYTTDSTEYDERFSEVRDTTAETQRLTTTSSGRKPCLEYEDCEPEVEVITQKRVVATPLPSSMPLLESHSRVRFPSESYPSPSRKTQQPPSHQFVRFPEMSHPHDDRPGLWYPTWHVRSHPAIRGWPPPESNEPSDMLHKQYPPYPHPAMSWSDNPSPSTAWRRRYFQRD